MFNYQKIREVLVLGESVSVSPKHFNVCVKIRLSKGHLKLIKNKDLLLYYMLINVNLKRIHLILMIYTYIYKEKFQRCIIYGGE